MTQKPMVSDDPMFLLLRDHQVDEFNRRRAQGVPAHLAGCDFSGVDLRGMEADGLDLGDCSFHQSDLRGVDLRNANLEGSSLHAARIAGAYFPVRLSAGEIDLSLQHGTRMRYGG